MAQVEQESMGEMVVVVVVVDVVLAMKDFENPKAVLAMEDFGNWNKGQ